MKNKKQISKNADWERYGILIALSGLFITSIFSIIQWQLTVKQLAQSQTSIKQTQDGLTETRRQNNITYNQLLLSQQQFKYSRIQDSIKNYQDSLHELLQIDQFERNINLLDMQREALIQGNKINYLDKSSNIIAFIEEDTSLFFLDTRTKLPVSFSGGSDTEINIYNIFKIYLENKGNSSAKIESARVYLFLADKKLYDSRSFEFSLDEKSKDKSLLDNIYNRSMYLSDPKFIKSCRFEIIDHKQLNSFAILPAKYIEKNSKDYFIRIDNYYHSLRGNIINENLLYILIELNTENELTKNYNKQYISFELFKKPSQLFHTISITTPQLQQKLTTEAGIFLLKRARNNE